MVILNFTNMNKLRLLQIFSVIGIILCGVITYTHGAYSLIAWAVLGIGILIGYSRQQSYDECRATEKFRDICNHLRARPTLNVFDKDDLSHLLYMDLGDLDVLQKTEENVDVIERYAIRLGSGFVVEFILIPVYTETNKCASYVDIAISYWSLSSCKLFKNKNLYGEFDIQSNFVKWK